MSPPLAEQETWESDVMESESDVGGSEDDDYGKAFDMAEDEDDNDDGDGIKEEPEPSDGEYVVPVRPIRKV